MNEQQLIEMRARDLATYGTNLHNITMGQLILAMADRHLLLDEAELQHIRTMRPAAWIRGVFHETDMGRDYDEECYPGSDAPPGNGWVPLYSRPNDSDMEIARLTDALHERRAHPDFEYETTRTARKSGFSVKPSGDGWEPNEYGGDPHSSWERFEFHEEQYWRRRKPAPTRAAVFENPPSAAESGIVVTNGQMDRYEEPPHKMWKCGVHPANDHQDCPSCQMAVSSNNMTARASGQPASPPDKPAEPDHTA